MSQIRTTTIENSKAWQLKALLGLAQDRGNSGDFLPANLRQRAELAACLSELCDGNKDSGDSLLVSICEPTTPLSVHQGVKELAKSLMLKAESDAQRAACKLLYHAAIAAALARHNQNISTRSGLCRLGLYEDLAVFLQGDPLGEVFQIAVRRMERQSESGNSS